jgi:hypothetical protein
MLISDLLRPSYTRIADIAATAMMTVAVLAGVAVTALIKVAAYTIEILINFDKTTWHNIPDGCHLVETF